MPKKAVIAMSGGVDSSVAAQLMLDKGYECVGVTMQMFKSPDASCGSLTDIDDARDICQKLGMEHMVLDFCDAFQKDVIERFIGAYRIGITPNPCIDCNKYIKFKRLSEATKSLEADVIVTGHYAVIEKADNRFLLKKAKDITKDQSYVLYSLSQNELSHTIFPLGGMTKAEVRALAEKYGFINAKKHDSQDICFAPDGYSKFIEEKTGEKPKKGKFLDINGNVIGEHEGIFRYTIGQRKGLGVSFGKPVFVCGIDAAANTVTLSDECELFTKTLTAKSINFIPFDVMDVPMKVKAKVRYRQEEQPATVTQTDADEFKVEFTDPVRAITPGQAVVLYDGDTVIGGGTVVGK